MKDPCRTGGANPASTTGERQANLKLIDRFKSEWSSYPFSAHINMADPIYFEYDDTWIMNESEMKKLENDQADVYFIAMGSGITQVRKAIRETRFLRIYNYTVDHVNGNFINVDHLERKFGIETVDLRIDKMVDEFDRIVSDKNSVKEVERITNQLVNDAKEVHMTLDMIKPSVIFHMAARNLMIKNRCNGFTIHCFI